jgi:hypothetical protein
MSFGLNEIFIPILYKRQSGQVESWYKLLFLCEVKQERGAPKNGTQGGLMVLSISL